MPCWRSGQNQAVALGLCTLARAGEGGISTSLVGRGSWMTPCLPTLPPVTLQSGRQNDLLVSCTECLFLLQPRHLQAPLFPRLLFCLSAASKRIALLPPSIPSCPSSILLAHLELRGLQRHLERCNGNRQQQLDHLQAPVLPWVKMWWRSIVDVALPISSP